MAMVGCVKRIGKMMIVGNHPLARFVIPVLMNLAGLVIE
jgi:hypothetical protein